MTRRYPGGWVPDHCRCGGMDEKEMLTSRSWTRQPNTPVGVSIPSMSHQSQRMSKSLCGLFARHGLRENLPWNIPQQAQSDEHCEMAIENQKSRFVDSLHLYPGSVPCCHVMRYNGSRRNMQPKKRSRKDASADRVIPRRGSMGGYFSLRRSRTEFLFVVVKTFIPTNSTSGFRR